MLKIFRHEGVRLILYNSGHQVTMCKRYSSSKTDVLQHWEAHPGQTGVAIIDTNLTGRTATSAIGVS
jgi:hypothetical protein